MAVIFLISLALCSLNNCLKNWVHYNVPDGTAVGVDGVGLQAFEFEVLEVGLIVLIKLILGAGGVHSGASLR